MKSISELYEEGIVKLGTRWTCPVCFKRYKSEVLANRHMEKQSCWRGFQLFEDEPEEEDILSAYKHIMYSYDKDALILYSSIKRTEIYNMLCLVYKICESNDVDFADYLIFGYNNSPVHNCKYMLTMLINHYETLPKYYKEYKIPNVTERESTKHLLSYREIYMESQSKFLTDFLRGKFRLDDVGDVLGENYLKDLPPAAKTQIRDVLS